MRIVRAGAVLAMLMAGPAWAQMDSREGIALQNQILELRRDLQAVQNQRGAPTPIQPYRNSGTAPQGGGEIAAQLLDRVQSMEDEIRRLHGQLDEQSNAARRQNDDLSKQIADLNFRLQNGGGARTPAREPAREPLRDTSRDTSRDTLRDTLRDSEADPSRDLLRGEPPTPLNPPPSQGGTGRRPPELAMQEGNAALARRDYAAAEASAREALGTARSGPRSADAQFLLAESLYGRRDYQGAAVAFDDSYSRSRTGGRAPDALLGLANALAGLGDRGSACQALDRLRAEFPRPRSDIQASATAARARSGCR